MLSQLSSTFHIHSVSSDANTRECACVRLGNARIKQLPVREVRGYVPFEPAARVYLALYMLIYTYNHQGWRPIPDPLDFHPALC